MCISDCLEVVTLACHSISKSSEIMGLRERWKGMKFFNRWGIDFKGREKGGDE